MHGGCIGTDDGCRRAARCRNYLHVFLTNGRRTFSWPGTVDSRVEPISARPHGSTWWQVKESNLRTLRDGFTVPRLQACDQRKRLTRNNFRAYSPQTAEVSRGQPDTSGPGNAPTVVANEGRICLPLRIRDRSQPSNAIEGATKVPHGGKYCLFVSRDLCRRGIDSTYSIVVGRAASVNRAICGSGRDARTERRRDAADRD
jgi:hypothetical protein